MQSANGLGRSQAPCIPMWDDDIPESARPQSMSAPSADLSAADDSCGAAVPSIPASQPSDRRAFLGDALKYLPSALVPTIMGLVLLPVLTRSFPPGPYGYYALATTTLAAAYMLVSSWLGSSIVRFYAADEMRGETHTLVSTVTGLAILWSVAVALALGITIAALASRLPSVLFALLLVVPLQLVAVSLLDVPMHFLRAQRRVALYNWLIAAKVAVAPLIGLGLSLWMGGEILWLMIGTTAITWLLVPIAYGSCFGRAAAPRFGLFSQQKARDLHAFGMPLIPSCALVSVLDVSDRFIVEAWCGASGVGIYNASYTLATWPMTLLTYLVAQSAAVVIVSTWERDGRAASEALQTFITRAYVLVGLPLVVGLSVLSRPIMTLFVARDYLDGVPVFPWVCAGGFLLGLQWIAQRGMMLAHQTRRILVVYLFAGTLNVVLNLVLVPRAGYIGAAWATFASYLVLLVVVAAGSQPELSWKLPVSTIARSVVATVLMGLAVHVLRQWAGSLAGLVTLTVSGAALYLSIMWLAGEFRDLGLLTSLVKRGRPPAA